MTPEQELTEEQVSTELESSSGKPVFPSDDPRTYRHNSNAHPGQAISTLAGSSSKWVKARIVIKGRLIYPEVFIFEDSERMIEPSTGVRKNRDGAWARIAGTGANRGRFLETKLLPLIGNKSRAIVLWQTFFRSRAIEPEIVL